MASATAARCVSLSNSSSSSFSRADGSSLPLAAVSSDSAAVGGFTAWAPSVHARGQVGPAQPDEQAQPKVKQTHRAAPPLPGVEGSLQGIHTGSLHPGQACREAGREQPVTRVHPLLTRYCVVPARLVS